MSTEGKQLTLIQEQNVDNLPKVIRHPYQLTRHFVKFKFTAGENRILIRILQRIKVYQEIDYSPQIDIAENIGLTYHWKDLLLKNMQSKDRLLKDLKSLREKSIQVASKANFNGKMETTEKWIGIIEKPEWNTSRSFVKINVDLELYKFLTDLSKGFTEYLAESSFGLNGTYTIKFYYFVAHWFDIGGKYLTLAQFRSELEIPEDKYVKSPASDFMRKIIKPAKEALDKNADISFNFTPKKNGRKIVGFSFKFIKTNNSSMNKHTVNNADDIFELLGTSFILSKEDKSRIIGIVNRYHYSFLKSVINTHHFDIKGHVDKGTSIPDALSKVILDHYSNIFKEEEQANTPN